MMRFRYEQVRRLMIASSSLAIAAAAASCQQASGQPSSEIEDPQVAVTTQAQGLGDLCPDLACPAEGIAEGNASISGVASVDAFFQSVLNFQGKADAVSGGINAELAAIRGDFGIAANANLAAELRTQITANVEGDLIVEAEPARCAVDAEATLEAQAKCDVTVKPGSAMVKCDGSCEVEASAKVECGAMATVKCTVNPPMGECSGSCKGSCTAELSAMAACSGTCRGSCDGSCSAYVKNASGEAECAGKCEGMCQGSCEVELAAEAECKGECRGECTFTAPDGKCEGGIRAHCEAMGNAMIDCKGRCEGNIEPPEAKAECEASAKAEAKLNVECTPPRLVVDYKLKATTSANAEAQARFVAAVKSLEVRLPALLASVKRAESVLSAGGELSGAGKAAVEGAVMVAVKGDAKLATKIGLGCALTELGAVQGAISGATGRLQASLTASAALKDVFDL
jgi:hypothetical protein